MASRQVYFQHAPWSPFVHQGMIWRGEFEAVEQMVTEGSYKLSPAQACEGMAVPESITGEMVLRPVASVTQGGTKSVMY